MTASAVDGRWRCRPLPARTVMPTCRMKEAGPMSVTDPELIIDDCEAGIFRVNREVMTSPAVLAAERTRIFDKVLALPWTRVRDRQAGRLQAPHALGPPAHLPPATPTALWMFFYDTCPHRGATLCRSEEGNAKRFTCFYHAWTFDTHGKLISCRTKRLRPGFDRTSVAAAAAAARQLPWLLLCLVQP